MGQVLQSIFSSFNDWFSSSNASARDLDIIADKFSYIQHRRESLTDLENLVDLLRDLSKLKFPECTASYRTREKLKIDILKYRDDLEERLTRMKTQHQNRESDRHCNYPNNSKACKGINLSQRDEKDETSRPTHRGRHDSDHKILSNKTTDLCEQGIRRNQNELIMKTALNRAETSHRNEKIGFNDNSDILRKTIPQEPHDINPTIDQTFEVKRLGEKQISKHEERVLARKRTNNTNQLKPFKNVKHSKISEYATGIEKYRMGSEDTDQIKSKSFQKEYLCNISDFSREPELRADHQTYETDLIESHNAGNYQLEENQLNNGIKTSVPDGYYHPYGKKRIDDEIHSIGMNEYNLNNIVNTESLVKDGEKNESETLEKVLSTHFSADQKSHLRECESQTHKDMKILDKVQRNVEDLTSKINTFEGYKSDNRFYELDETINRMIISLDRIESTESDLRKRKIAFLKKLHQLGDNLEDRAK